MTDQKDLGATPQRSPLHVPEAAPQLTHDDRRACACDEPEPMMQADGGLYCQQCSFVVKACPDCVKGLQPSTWLDDEQPMRLCSTCDGSGVIATDDQPLSEASGSVPSEAPKTDSHIVPSAAQKGL